MSFKGFDKEDFAIFTIDGLDNRMKALQERLQPKFAVLGEELTADLSAKLGNEMFLHIAKHARRTVNPPDNTWLAIADSKKGYKKHPHFQVGLWEDHVFIWLALIYELDGKQQIASSYLNHFTELKELPNDYVISLDHMTNAAIDLPDLSEKHLIRFRDVKKCEFLLGKQISRDDAIHMDGHTFINVALEVIHSLIPFYKLAMQSRNG